MKKYVICENHWCSNELIAVNIIGVCDSIETANNIIQSNREDLMNLYDGKYVYDFVDSTGFHEFETKFGDVFRTGCVSTEYTEG